MKVIDADFSQEFRFEVENLLNKEGHILAVKMLLDLELDNSFARAIVKNITKKKKLTYAKVQKKD